MTRRHFPEMTPEDEANLVADIKADIAADQRSEDEANRVRPHWEDDDEPAPRRQTRPPGWGDW